MVTAILKEKLRHARGKIPDFFLDQRLVSDERGLLGGFMTAAAIIAVFAAVLAIIGGFELIMKAIAGGLKLGKLLIHIPPFNPTNFSFVTIPKEGIKTGGVFYASTVMSKLYPLFVTAAFAVLTVAFVVIGLSYGLESFNIVSPSTSEKLLSESVLVLILIFLFPWIYNIGAMALNTLNQNMIMHAGNVGYQNMVASVAGDAADFPALLAKSNLPVLGWLPAHADPTKALTALVCASATFMSLLIALATGVFKVLATGAFATAFPLILTLRLIPVTRDVADRIISGVIGLMLTSTIIALFFRFGWGILDNMSSGIMHWAVAVAILMTAAGAMTIATPVLSGMSAEISGTLGRSTAGAIAGYVAMGTTAGLGGAAAGTMAGGRILAGKATGSGAASAMGGREAFKTVGRAALKGTARGAPGKDVAASMGAGLGAGREEATKGMAGAIPARGDVEVTHSSINSQMSNVTSERLKGLSDGAKQKLVAKGKSIADRGIDKLSDERVLDAYGRHLAADGKMESYSPKHDREALRESVSPDEIREGLKGSLSDMKDQVPEGDQRAYGAPGAGAGSSNDEAYARLGAYLSRAEDLQREYGP